MTRTRYYFCCITCHKNWLGVPAKGYWKTIKEWICDKCKEDDQDGK